MKISVFYFSGTGNTWWVCNEFMKLAKERNHSVQLYNIEKPDEFKLNHIMSDSDVLGIAYPIYGSTFPQITKEFLEALVRISIDIPQDKKPQCFVLTSMMLFSGDGAIMPAKYLKNAQIPFKWALNLAISSNISVPGFRMNPYSEKRIKKHMMKANSRLSKFLDKIELNQKSIQIQLSFIGRFLGWTQRVFLKRSIDAILNYSVDSELCTKCQKCVRQCPVENIVYDEISEQFSFLDNCVWCMRCYNLCPTQAIMVNKHYCDPKKFRRMHPISKEYKIR